MKDRIFAKLGSHQINLKKYRSELLYIDEEFHKIVSIGSFFVNRKIGELSILNNYTFFKDIKITDILFLRKHFDIDNPQHILWLNRIHRFLEYRLSTIHKRLNKNYKNKEEQVNFIQNVITLLLERYVKCGDERFLSIVLKLLRIESLGKYGFYNNKISAQYSYNLLACYNLLNNPKALLI